MSNRRPTKSATDEEYGRFLFSSYGIDPETGEAIDPRQSKGSTKLQATRHLHKMGSRLKDAHSRLLESQDILKDDSQTKKCNKKLTGLLIQWLRLFLQSQQVHPQSLRILSHQLLEVDMRIAGRSIVRKK
jgi:hypothetical protein